MGISTRITSGSLIKGSASAEKDFFLNRWFQRILDDYAGETASFLKGRQDRFANPVAYALRAATDEIYRALFDDRDVERSPLEYAMKIKAVQELDPSKGVSFIHLLKDTVRETLANSVHENELADFDSRIDRIASIASDMFLVNRAKIAQISVTGSHQPRSRLIEAWQLSAPVEDIMNYFFAVIIPYAAAIIFLAGIVYKVARWAAAPVPFRIPTTCGQQRSLPWIKSNRLDNPHSMLGVIGRMALEILLFRSLFRNTKTDLKPGPALVYGSAKWLWLGALAFHWSLLVILIRHLRFFTEPQPGLITILQSLDGFFQVGVPVLFVSDTILAARWLFF